MAADVGPGLEALGDSAPWGRRGLAAALDVLDPGVLRAATGVMPASLAYGHAVIYDEHSDPQEWRDAVVLGVGISPSEAGEVAQRIGEQGAVALVLRGPLGRVPDVERWESETGILILELAPSATWERAAGLLSEVLDVAWSDITLEHEIAQRRGPDLVALCDVISSFLNAPITIEDPQHRLLAYSSNQSPTDKQRVDTILGRRMPDELIEIDEGSGMMEQVRQSQRPLFLVPTPDKPPGTLPRVAQAVRAGPEYLCTIWAIVTEPLSPEREELLVQASRLVATQLIHQRFEFDPADQMTDELVSSVLQGGSLAGFAASRLRLREASAVVLVVDEPQPVDLEQEDPGLFARHTSERRRLAKAFGVHLETTHPGTLVAVVHGRIYAIVPGQVDQTQGLQRSAERFLARMRPGDDTLIGIGRVAAGSAQLPRSRDDAESAVIALRETGADQRVADAAELAPDRWLLELRRHIAATGEVPTAAYRRLLAYDDGRGREMLPSLRAWLDTHGDIVLAADRIHVHQNTIRYRLRRIAEIAQVDLDDPTERFNLSLQLRLFGTGPGSPGGD
jgi:hypothetical protein